MGDAKRIALARAAIAAERKRQIEVEGYDAAHDDAHVDGELLRAAVLYYANAKRLPSDPPMKLRADGAPVGWPWKAEWWKPDGGCRDIERAGALALAERDRLRRKHLPVEHVNGKLSLIIRLLADHPRSGLGAPA